MTIVYTKTLFGKIDLVFVFTFTLRQKTYTWTSWLLSLMQCYSETDCLKNLTFSMSFICTCPYSTFHSPLYPFDTIVKYGGCSLQFQLSRLHRYIALQNLYQGKLVLVQLLKYHIEKNFSYFITYLVMSRLTLLVYTLLINLSIK